MSPTAVRVLGSQATTRRSEHQDKDQTAAYHVTAERLELHRVGVGILTITSAPSASAAIISMASIQCRATSSGMVTRNQGHERFSVGASSDRPASG